MKNMFIPLIGCISHLQITDITVKVVQVVCPFRNIYTKNPPKHR